MSAVNVNSSPVYPAILSSDPHYDESNRNALWTFMQLVKTCIGPFGKPKIIQNVTGGDVIVTSSSLRILHCISIKNIFLKFIKSSIKSHLSLYDDAGLYCALLTTELLINSLKSPCSLPILSELNEYFSNLFIESLQCLENASVFTIDFSNTTHMMSFVHSIISSKPSCLLSNYNKQHISLLILKTFLNSLSETASHNFILSQNISFCKLEGVSPAESQLFSGLLIPCSKHLNEKFVEIFAEKGVGIFKIVLFSVSLAGDADFAASAIEEHELRVWDEVLRHLKMIVQKLISDKVDIVVCQKVIHPVLKAKLESNGILVIDRLGLMQTQALQYLSGTAPCASLSLSSIETYGTVTSVNLVGIGKQKHFLLQNENNSFWTLLICNFNEEAVNETVATCKQALNALYRLLKCPKVCCGAGCTEIHTASLIQKKIMKEILNLSQEMNCSVQHLLLAFQNFLNTIANIAVSMHQEPMMSFATESKYQHLWKLSGGNFPTGNVSCACGQFVACDVLDTEWEMLFDKFSNLSANLKQEKKSIVSNLDKYPSVIDELSSKINAVSVASETSCSLLRVKLCILNAS